jgi:LacI family transcriptional regulator
MKITLRDVAKESGLSVTTVSRALNGHDDVAAETKLLVKQIADALGYSPNLSARRLKMQRAHAVGLILPNDELRFSDPFFSELFSGIVEQSALFGLELNVTTAVNVAQAELYLNFIRGGRVDGFILVRLQQEDERVALLQQHDFPFVAFGRMSPTDTFPLIDEDGEFGIRQVIDHLVELGHTRIACIAEPAELMKSHQRVAGYLSGLAAWGLPADPELVIHGQFRQRSGRICGHHLLGLDNPPTAIVAVNDMLALGAMKAAQELDLVIGRDVSITGFDDIPIAEYAHPPLTTVHQPAHEMGMMLCDKLHNAINGKAIADPQTVFRPKLVVRQSTGRPQ